MSESRVLYIDLLKKCLLGNIYDTKSGKQGVTATQCEALLQKAEDIFKPYLAPLGHSFESYVAPHADGKFPLLLSDYLNKMHRDMTPDTMSPPAFVDNLQFCIEEVIKNRVPGDLIETGVWKGGLPVLMRGILKAYGIVDRVVWVADSFAGLPKPDPAKHLRDAMWYFLTEPIEALKIPLDYVENIFRKYDLLDEQVKFLQGWFADTLPNAPIQNLAVMRLDGDWYESTMCSLKALYPKLSPGGFVIIDDYGLPLDCKRAVDEYRQIHHIKEPKIWINNQAIYWQKVE